MKYALKISEVSFSETHFKSLPMSYFGEQKGVFLLVLSVTVSEFLSIHDCWFILYCINAIKFCFLIGSFN